MVEFDKDNLEKALNKVVEERKESENQLGKMNKEEREVSSFLDKNEEEASSISEDIEEIGNVSLSDNFDKVTRKVSEVDEDLINKIIFNKFEDDEEEEEK